MMATGGRAAGLRLHDPTVKTASECTHAPTFTAPPTTPGLRDSRRPGDGHLVRLQPVWMVSVSGRAPSCGFGCPGLSLSVLTCKSKWRPNKWPELNIHSPRPHSPSEAQPDAERGGHGDNAGERHAEPLLSESPQRVHTQHNETGPPRPPHEHHPKPSPSPKGSELRSNTLSKTPQKSFMTLA